MRIVCPVETWELVARESIRDLVARYTWAGDRGRIGELIDLFTPDGVLDVGAHGGRWEGREAIAAGLAEVVERGGASPGPVHHHVASVGISDLTTERATVRSYYAVHTGSGLDHWGRYRDTVVADRGRWLFAERVVTVDGASSGSRFVDGHDG